MIDRVNCGLVRVVHPADLVFQAGFNGVARIVEGGKDGGNLSEFSACLQVSFCSESVLDAG